MTLDEAIKELTHLRKEYRKEYLYTFNQAPIDASQLGIEAIKRLKESREWHRSTADGPLPGETEE